MFSVCILYCNLLYLFSFVVFGFLGSSIQFVFCVIAFDEAS